VERIHPAADAQEIIKSRAQFLIAAPAFPETASNCEIAKNELANENPRIVIPENLENMPQVNVVTREEADQAEPDAQPVLQKTNKLMEL
jgi:hypothetical protein